MYEAAASLGTIVFVLIYLALFYLTFLYRWPAQSPQTPSNSTVQRSS